MVRRNYKNFANIGLSHLSTRKFVTILDIISPASFIKRSSWTYMKKSDQVGNPVKICDAYIRSLNVDGTIDLFFNIGGSVETIRLNVV